MQIGIPKEFREGERRVALVPESVGKLVKAGIEVVVERGAGEAAFLGDGAYEQAGARLEVDPAALLGESDFVLKVQPPAQHPSVGRHEAELLKEGGLLLCLLRPTVNAEAVQKLAERKVSALAVDCIPPTARAQAMNALSAMASISGYKAVLIAASELPKYFPMFMTAAGTVFAAKVFVIGADVAGLQAIATARRLGGAVIATDVRASVAEQIQSLGGRFVGPKSEEESELAKLIAAQCAVNDVVITTVLTDGVRAPKLITAGAVEGMRPGSVIVDLAAPAGGNCELSEPGRTVVRHGVKICALLNLPSEMPLHGSTLYSRNLTTFVLEFWKGGEFNLDLEDEIIAAALVTHQGLVRHAGAREALEGGEGR